MSHPDAERLAALADGGLLEEEAAKVRAHLEGCAPCSEAAAELAAIRARVAAIPAGEGRAGAVARRAMQSRQRRAPAVVALGGVAVAALVGVFVLGGRPEVQARGAADAPRAVHTQVWRHGPEGPVRLADGDRAPRALEVSVEVSALGATGRYACVARDASGRVTWLRPAWPGGEVPSLPPLTGAPGVFGGGEAVRIPSPATGALEVVALVVDEGLDAASLDGKLESGWRPVAGSEGVNAVQRVVVFVEGAE